MHDKRPTLWPSILAGAGSGALVLVMYGWFTTQNAPETEQSIGVSAAQPISVPADTTDAENQRRLAMLEQQLASLATAASAQRATVISTDKEPDTLVREPNSMASTDPEQPLPIEDAKRLAIQAWEQKRADFLLEPIDPRWAHNTSEMFRADIETLAQGQGFSIIQSDCRTSHCAVIIEWASFEDAVDGFKTLLHHDYQANCARETLLPDPDPAAAGSPYLATVIFDCSEWRQQS